MSEYYVVWDDGNSGRRYKYNGDLLDLLFKNMTLQEGGASKKSSSTSRGGRYSKWMTLEEAKDIKYRGPGTYQFKTRGAEKAAYIGKSDVDVRQRIKQHTYEPKQHVDEYIQRNKPDVRVRYKKCSNASKAEIRQLDQHYKKYDNLPKYNKKYGN